MKHRKSSLSPYQNTTRSFEFPTKIEIDSIPTQPSGVENPNMGLYQITE